MKMLHLVCKLYLPLFQMRQPIYYFKTLRIVFQIEKIIFTFDNESKLKSALKLNGEVGVGYWKKLR
jgi:hypothetical protein